MRHDLRVRLAFYTVAVVTCAVLCTLFLASTTVSGYNQTREGVKTRADDAIEADVIAWAGAHPSWSGIQPELSVLSKRFGRRVVLRSVNGSLIDDTAAGEPVPAGQVSDVDALLTSTDPSASIDPGVIGPFRLTVRERAALGAAAVMIVNCAAARGQIVKVRTWASGRPVLLGSTEGCRTRVDPTRGERAALDELRGLVNACLLDAGEPAVSSITFAQGATAANGPAFDLRWPHDHKGTTVDGRCLNAARTLQARAYVAPPATLLTTALPGPSQVDLSPGSVARIAATAALMLTLIVAFVLLVTAPIRARVRELTSAAKQLTAGRSVTVAVRGEDDVAVLGRALNQLSERLMASESHRRRLAANIAHELRTPLTNIRLWLEAANDGVIPANTVFIRTLDEESDQLQKIVQDLHDLTQVDAGELYLNQHEIDLTALLVAAGAAHRARALAANVDLQVDVSSGLETTGDARRLRQAIDNLLVNAIRHAAGSTVQLSARARAGATEIVVEDTGPGIAAPDLPHVFERFWRADSARTRTLGMSGLGLSITREMVHAHRGTVTAQSPPGLGARFLIRLPRSANQK